MLNLLKTLIENIGPEIDNNIDNCENDICKEVNKIYNSVEEVVTELVSLASKSLETIKQNVQVGKKYIIKSTPKLMVNQLVTREFLNSLKDMSVCVIEKTNELFGIDTSEDKLSEDILSKLLENVGCRAYTSESLIVVAAALFTNMIKYRDILYDDYKILTKAASECNDDECKSKILIKSKTLFKFISLLVIASSRAIDIIECASKPENSLTEATQLNNEDVDTYVNELNKLIPELRDFYDKFEYKDLIEPRYKKIDKMNEYMIGALQRKYTLKIPMYKVLNTTEEVRDIVENKFIKKLEQICNKYPNYILLTPNFDENNDMFIYVTLKEPFGDETDRSDRKVQSVKKGNALTEGIIYEGTLSAKDRKELDDEVFGLPNSRRYPLNDKEHIIKAIQFFKYCKPADKKELARNIVKQIIKLDLVGSIKIADSNFNKKYFPSWMTEEKAICVKKDGKYTIYVDKTIVATGTLTEAVTNIKFFI